MINEELMKEFLMQKVNPLLERAIVDMLIENPDDIVANLFPLLFLIPAKVEFMLAWLKDKGRNFKFQNFARYEEDLDSIHTDSEDEDDIWDLSEQKKLL